MTRPLVIGTRGSALALAQVDLLMAAFAAAKVDLRVEVKKITTSGDRRSRFVEVKETGAGIKGLFTREIEQALLDRAIDVAVHSCKDLPGHTSPGLVIPAVLPREDTQDLFIGREVAFEALPPGAVVATGSVRRRRQVMWLRNDLVIEELRGNVPTRLQKLRDSTRLAGVILARAGINRLAIDLAGFHVSPLPVLPAIGQGAIALQCREEEAEAMEILARVNHLPTFTCIRAERELLRLLNGDCHLPVAAKTRLESDRLVLDAIVFGAEDEPPAAASAEGPADHPELLAAEVLKQLAAARPELARG